jgi:hypothetical protein
MLNIVSLFIGAVGLLLAFPALLPFLGWMNWLLLPIPVIGLALGVVSSRTSGRNLNILVLVIMIVRLSIGGGLL